MIYPDVQDFKDFFDRDFPFDDPLNPDPNNHITDKDIERAIREAKAMFLVSCFSTQEEFSIAFLYLVASILCNNISNSNSGLSSAFTWATTSKSVGNVSIGSVIPDKILKNPSLAMLAQNGYGAKYLQLILPCITGVVINVPGRTTP